jgi:O-succinylbenzoate synthase
MRLPTVDELLANVRVVALPMRTRFRGLDVRETMLIASPMGGWGEFAAFPEYDDVESAPWLACAIEQAWNQLPTIEERPVFREVVRSNATLPAVDASDVASILERFGDFRTVKVKVAEPGQTLGDDVARVRAAREYVGAGGRVRIDANGGWNVDEAEHAIRALEQFDLTHDRRGRRNRTEFFENVVESHNPRGRFIIICDESEIREA